MQSSKIHAKITVRAEYFGGVADDPMIVRAMWHDGWELVSHTPNPHMKPEAIISKIKEFFGVRWWPDPVILEPDGIAPRAYFEWLEEVMPTYPGFESVELKLVEREMMAPEALEMFGATIH